jgi:hypothetical protein
MDRVAFVDGAGPLRQRRPAALPRALKELGGPRPGDKPRSADHELAIQKIQAYGDAAIRVGVREIGCDVEYMKVAILDALDAAGAGYLVHALAVEAVVQGNRIGGVVLGTKRGLMIVRAKTVVDGAGDADVAYYAGAETMTQADALMPMTLAVAATDPAARSKAECDSRRQALQMVQAIRESDDPAPKQIEWAAGGPQGSVRETRRVKGVYILTEEDAKKGRTFEDAIA